MNERPEWSVAQWFLQRTGEGEDAKLLDGAVFESQSDDGRDCSGEGRT